MTRELALKEGIFAGVSSGAILYAALQFIKELEDKDSTVVVILPDGGDKYLSLMK